MRPLFSTRSGRVGRDKFTITFDKTAGAAAALVEYLTRSGELAGRLLSLRGGFTELSTQKKSASQTEFRIR